MRIPVPLIPPLWMLLRGLAYTDWDCGTQLLKLIYRL